jgi:adenosylcobinamide-phosphate synthase
VFVGLEYVIAYILDLSLGDPKWLGYPVVWLGKAISFLERKLRESLRPGLPPARYEKRAGFILTGVIVAGSFLLAWLIIKLAYQLHPLLGLALSVWGAFTVLSIRGLAQGGERVALALDDNNLRLARESLAHIVGRDTDHLKKSGLIKGALESVSENTIDGIVAPLFYLFLGGVPLALVYKAINTLDSMIGHRNRKYKHFGYAAAKLDDIANYIPARIGGVLVVLAALLFGKNAKGAFRTMLREGRQYNGPNAGLSQGAMAGALGVRLGGVNYYQGQRIVKPYLGRAKEILSVIHIRGAVKLMYLVSFFALILGLLMRWLIIR